VEDWARFLLALNSLHQEKEKNHQLSQKFNIFYMLDTLIRGF
jgi:hypothetical protein